MQIDFHYYATYCAAYIAGYSHEDSLVIATCSQLVDECSDSFIKKLHAPGTSATTQQQLEMMDINLNPVSIQEIVRIWSSFHFLPYDLYANFPKKRNKAYMDKYRLICKPNSDLLVDTINLAKDKSLQAVGLAMHVLADTWAHSYFAGVPSLVINNINFQFYEILADGERPVVFKSNPMVLDDPESGKYVNSLYQGTEFSIMNLGHGRAGHLPDYSFIKYRYVPAWGNYTDIIKDNPTEYLNAFCQMIYAMKYLRGEIANFEKECYAIDEISKWQAEIHNILSKRQVSASDDWKEFGKKISGYEIPDFSVDLFEQEYLSSSKDDKDKTFLGQFFTAATAQKSMVTNRIFKSGNLLAGKSVESLKRRLIR